MIRDQILTATQTAIKGSRKVRITFIPEGIGYVSYLQVFATNLGMIELGEDELIILAIVASQQWDGDNNRTVTITLTDEFDITQFANRFQHALEKIEVVS
jgi:hypothetical protein